MGAFIAILEIIITFFWDSYTCYLLQRVCHEHKDLLPLLHEFSPSWWCSAMPMHVVTSAVRVPRVCEGCPHLVYHVALWTLP